MLLISPLLAAGGAPATQPAGVTVAAVFGDNMVLQRDMKCPVWGEAAPGEKVKVSIVGQNVSSIADANGKWNVVLDPMKAGGPFELTIAGSRKLAYKNVMIGEVWVCAGQSNMDHSLAQLAGWAKGRNEPYDIEADVKNAALPQLRLFTARTAWRAFLPEEKWVECTQGTAKNFSGTGFHFASALQRHLKVPVGVIDISWGGSQIAQWIAPEGWEDSKLLGASAAKQLEEARNEARDYDARLAAWRLEVIAVEKAVKAPPPQPWMKNVLGAINHEMVRPLIPMAIRGVVWYQGESDVRGDYAECMRLLIRDWRRQWGQGEFPFLYVQLANIGEVQTKVLDGRLHGRWCMRELQRKAWTEPASAMVVTVDTAVAGPSGKVDEHPWNKRPIGERLALAARAIAYGEKIVYSGPLYDSMKVEGGKIRLSFKHVGAGLVAKGDGVPGSKGDGDGKLKGFAVAGVDKTFYWAQTRIEGENVLVWSDKAPSPVAVRYAIAENPVANLHNKEGLPAVPFCTDDWSSQGKPGE